jgi:cytochrome c oxidase subunit 3
MQRHTFHLVKSSPWPFSLSLGALMVTIGAVYYFHSSTHNILLLIFGFFYCIFIMILWWRDIIRESTFQGHHTKKVQLGLRLGIVLFIISEIMFFFGFFWAYFHSSLAPTIEIGCIWPPYGIIIVNPFGVPLLNTAILLLSGATVTWAHYALSLSLRIEAIKALFFTIFLGLIFILLQIGEYFSASFSISDGIYGSNFYMLTGFHGFHVIIGTVLLIVSFFRIIFYHFTKSHHIGFIAAAWYWHFVDVVWLFLFITVYWWGSLE